MQNNSSISTSTKELPNTMEKISVGTYHTRSGDITTITRFISAALAPLKNLVRKVQTWNRRNPTTKITIPSEWTASLQKQLNLHHAYSTTSPVVLVPLIPHPLHYLEVSTFRPQKQVRFLHHPYPRESNLPRHL
jgi:hypothetical protein